MEETNQTNRGVLKECQDKSRLFGNPLSSGQTQVLETVLGGYIITPRRVEEDKHKPNQDKGVSARRSARERFDCLLAMPLKERRELEELCFAVLGIPLGYAISYEVAREEATQPPYNDFGSSI